MDMICKGTYLLGRCGSMEIAWERRLSLIEFGIDLSIIKIHPEDYFDANRNQLIELGYDVDIVSYHEIKFIIIYIFKFMSTVLKLFSYLQ